MRRRHFLTVGLAAGCMPIVSACSFIPALPASPSSSPSRSGPVTPGPTPTGTVSPSPASEQAIMITQGTVGTVGAFRVGFANVYKGSAQFVVWNDADPLRVESTVTVPDDGTFCIAGRAVKVAPVAGGSRAVRALTPVSSPIVAPAGSTDIVVYPEGSARMVGVSKVVINELSDHAAQLLVEVTSDGPSVWVTATEGTTLTLGEHALKVTSVRAGRGDAMGYVAWRMPA